MGLANYFSAIDVALVYFNGPWENVLILGMAILDILMLQITNNSNLTLPNLT